MQGKAAAIALLMIGVTGTGFGVSGFLNARVRFCNPQTNPCTTQILIAGVSVPEGAKFVRYQPGDPAAKLIGSLVGVFSFLGAAALCRGLAEEELRLLGFRQISDEDDLSWSLD